MPTNLASPGIVVKEVDLTIGRVDPTSGPLVDWLDLLQKDQ